MAGVGWLRHYEPVRRQPTASGRIDPAVAAARAVVGLYGDPTVSWSIALDATPVDALDPLVVAERAQELAEAHPHLGRTPLVRSLGAVNGDAAEVLRDLLDAPYGDHDPLLRIGLGADGHRIVVAAHHGAVDGLGLVAALGSVAGLRLVSSAKGIGGEASRASFALSSATRLREAAVSPPNRIVRSASREGSKSARGDVTARHDMRRARANTARAVFASLRAVVDRNRAAGGSTDRLVVAIGASRRDGTSASPDRDTAYLRLRLPASSTPETVRRVLAETLPEPTFPARTGGGWAAVATRTLRHRLGSTLLVSNLGLVEGAVVSVAFYPAAAGDRALAVGVASTSTHTTVTVRMPRMDFDAETADELCKAIATRLARPAAGQ